MSVLFPQAQFLGDAKVSGSLYDLGEYPGMLLDKSTSLVIGEVYEVDEKLLNILDQFEASSDYWRKQVEISLGGATKTGWTYEPKPELCAQRQLITSGDWLQYATTRTPHPSTE